LSVPEDLQKETKTTKKRSLTFAFHIEMRHFCILGIFTNTVRLDGETRQRAGALQARCRLDLALAERFTFSTVK
jgi:hypothetical protein